MGEVITLESFLQIKKEEFEQKKEILLPLIEDYIQTKKKAYCNLYEKINKEEEYLYFIREISLIEQKLRELEIFESFDFGETDICKDKFINYVTKKICDLFLIKNPYPLFILYSLATIPLTYKEIENLLVFFVGRSGLGKSELIRLLDGLEHKLKIPRLTANTLVTGSKDVNDLAPSLKNKIVISQEFAEFVSMDTDAKREIWGQLRELTDGMIGKYSGTGKRQVYEGITPFVWIFNTTRVIQNEILLQQVLGTRFLLIDFDLIEIFNEKEVENLILNETEDELLERRKIAQNLFRHAVEYLKILKNSIKSNNWDENFLKEIADIIIQMRSEVPTDWQTGELLGKYEFYIESKKRILKQLKLISENINLYCFKEDVENILKWIAISNIDYLRFEILKLLENTDAGNGYKTRTIARDLNRSYKLVFRTLCLLQGAGFVDFVESDNEYERPHTKAREWFITEKGKNILKILEEGKKIKDDFVV